MLREGGSSTRPRWTGWPTTASRRHLGLRRGRGYFPYSPLLVVESTFAEAVLLETLLLSIYNHDSAIASAASRMTLAAGDRPCIEMGSRRTHEEAAVAAARAAYVAGFATHLQPRRPAAVRRPDRRHVGALLHAAARHRGATRSAPRSTSLGTGTTLLVDTYDVAEAVRLGGRGRRARARRGAARLRRPGRLAHQVRAQLDALGATGHPDRGDQRPRRVRHRRRSPRRRSTGTASAPSWSPAAATRPAASSTSWSPREGADGELVSVAKKSKDKISIGGRKCALRRLSPRGVAEAEVIGIGEPPPTTATTGRCWCRWCAAARSSAASRSRRPARGTWPPARSCPLIARMLSKGETVLDTIHL